MRLAVPALVVCRVVEPEVGAEIDEGDAAVEDRRRDRLAVPMRKRGEDEIDAVEAPSSNRSTTHPDKQPRDADGPRRAPARPCCRRTASRRAS